MPPAESIIACGGGRAAPGSRRPLRLHGPITLFDSRRVAMDVLLADKQAALSEIGRLVERVHGQGAIEVTRRLARRESLGSTVVCPGIAVPHTSLSGLSAAMAIYLRAQTGIPFDLLDGRPVRHILALLVPRPPTAAHFELLRRVMLRMSDPEVSRRLGLCHCPRAACDALAQAVWD